MLTVQL